MFVIVVYRKPTFSGVYTHFDSFLPTIYNFGIFILWLSNIFQFVPTGPTFHDELAFLKQIFLKNGCPISFIDKRFKTFLDQLYLKRTQVLTAEKKTLTLAFLFLDNFSFKPG